jgi:hypothetical protein
MFEDHGCRGDSDHALRCFVIANDQRVGTDANALPSPFARFAGNTRQHLNELEYPLTTAVRRPGQ